MHVNMPRRIHVPYIAMVSVIATAYWATGSLALLLAIPPGYATAIWPPAGIALAAFLVYGARVWPGIVLGSFLVNVWTAFDPTNVLSILQSLALPASIGIGAALQAHVGACLVRRVVGFSMALDREHDVTWFLVLGGPVSCLVGPTWGVTSLLASGIVPWSNALFTWWTWWVGDTIGALVVTPLILVWTAAPRQVWRRRQLSVALPLCLAFGLVVVFFVYEWIVLTSGLLFVGLLGGFLLVLTGRAIRMGHLVAERTAANATLAREIAERTRVEAALAAEARFLHAQTEVAAAALSSLDADTLALQLLAVVCRAQEYAYGLLWRTVDDERTAMVAASYGDKTAPFLGYRVRLDEPTTFIAQVIHSRQPLFCNRVPESPYATRPMIEALGGQALLGVPLVSRTGHVLGALAFGDAHNPERFAARDLQQGAVLAHQVAQAIDNSVLFQQLQQLEEQYRVVTETLHDAVYVVNRDGRIVFANAALERLTGYHTAELRGQPSLMLYPPETIPDLLQRRSAIFSGQDVSPYMQMPIRHKQGQRILVELSRAALYQNAQMTGYVVVARDLTERLHLEAQLRQVQKLQAIGTLAGGIAHDFNNILSVILGYTELAMDDVPPTTRTRDNLEQVLIAGYRAKDLVQQILTFSRRGEADAKPVELAPLVTEALTLLRAALPSTIAMRRELDAETGTVLADPTQLHQVLINLCTNAAHAMRDAGGVLTVRLDACEVTASAAVHPELTPGSYLRLMVQDTGHGMPPTILERIFEPFFTTKGVGEGTGMGLAVVHGIVTRCGGAIAVESTPGHGTTCTVYLPRSDQPAAALTGLEDAVPRGTERILFVDDEEALAQFGDQFLTRLGYDVVTRTNSVEAWEAFREQPDRFDLVITDQTMPHMTGDVLARALRQMRSDLPIILCTGFSHWITAEQADASGIDAVCLKPLVLRDLARTIRQVFAQRPAQQA